jgi:putative transposase
VLLKIVYLLTCRVLGLAVLMFRGDLAKDAELLVLRHENAVLRRQADRVRYRRAGRLWLAALSRLNPRRQWGEVLAVTLATLLACPAAYFSRNTRPRTCRSPGPDR